jgi:hypothetical protein
MSFWSPADTLATRRPGVVYPGGAGSLPQVVPTSDVLRDRAAGITRDPTKTPGSWIDTMNGILGTVVTIGGVFKSQTKARGSRRAGTPMPTQAGGGTPIGAPINTAWVPVIVIGLLLALVVFAPPRLLRMR